jgi:sulfatase maturation enzyme AslB (radical SAM superfamily)
VLACYINKVYLLEMIKNFCAYPRFHLQIKPSGMIKPCCRFDVEVARKLTDQKSRLDMLHSDAWGRLREEMDNNQTHPGCAKCLMEEKINIPSMRMDVTTLMRRWGIDASDVGLQDLEIGFGNLCNLACRSCSSHLSSRWFEEDHIINQVEDLDRRPSQVKIVNAELRFMGAQDVKDLKSVKFTGGEPLLHPEFWRFLKLLLDADIQDHVSLRVCTNGTFLPKKEHLDLLKKFSKIYLGLSIDGYGQHNDYLRYPSRWEDVDKVLQAWRTIVDQEKTQWLFILSSTISAYSVEAYQDLRQWWMEFKGLRDPNRYYMIHQPVFDPFYLSPAILPRDIVDQFTGFAGTEAERYFSSQDFSQKNLGLFLKFSQSVDSLRKQNIAETFPKLSRLVRELV